MSRSQSEMIELLRAALEEDEGTPSLATLTVKDVDEHVFDESYIQFLDQQIELNARGDAWSERLRRRRDVLATWTDRSLVRVVCTGNGREWWFDVDPESKRVLRAESYVLS